MSSVYVTFTGAYIIHDPPGDASKQESVSPAAVLSDGQSPDVMDKDVSLIATYPDGHDVDNVDANALIGIKKQIKNIHFFICAPF